MVRGFQRIVDPITVRLLGDHLLREPLEHVEAEGFDVQRLERTKWGAVERVSAVNPAGRNASTAMSPPPQMPS